MTAHTPHCADDPEHFTGVQRIVLHGSPWRVAQHLVLEFLQPQSACLNFLQAFVGQGWPTKAGGERHTVGGLQVSIGFSRRGLQHARVPAQVLAAFALKAPAFTAGAAVRAASRAAAAGSSLPDCWDAAYDFESLDAVVSVHADDLASLLDKVATINQLAADAHVRLRCLPLAEKLPRPHDVPASPENNDPKAQWAHFGYRDGLARVGIEGYTRPADWARLKETSRHSPGEFLLGRAQDSGANPWIAGPGLRVWPKALRSFFHNGSFGVLHQVQQDVQAFEEFVAHQAHHTGRSVTLLKSKLCGRTPAGHALAAPTGAALADDFDFQFDRKGLACPFGSHIRRMNPRDDELAHAGRTRAVLRRGMPYGPAWAPGDAPDAERGLLGQFFCASIEDQFEHLLGQWADRVPLGSADLGGARDPFIGDHQLGDGPFLVPLLGQRPMVLAGLQACTRTRGTAYLFYPSACTLQGIAKNSLWGLLDKEET